MTAVDQEVQALFDAALQGDVSQIWSLIEADSSLVWEQIGHLTALHVAAMAGKDEAVSLLIMKRAAVNTNGSAGTPLFQATLAGHEAVVECLLANGADPNLTTPSGQTPLMAAAFCGQLTIARALIANGANLDARSSHGASELVSDAKPVKGETALHLTAANGDVGFAQLLLESGAQRDIEDNSDKTPRDWALQHQHEAVTGLLRGEKRS